MLILNLMRNILLFIGLLTLTACGSEEIPTTPRIQEVSNFLNAEPDRIQMIKGEEVAIYAFRNEEESRRYAESVSEDATLIAGELIQWDTERHFFLAGRAIALYTGDNPVIINALEKLYGAQFAGS